MRGKTHRTCGGKYWLCDLNFIVLQVRDVALSSSTEDYSNPSINQKKKQIIDVTAIHLAGYCKTVRGETHMMSSQI